MIIQIQFDGGCDPNPGQMYGSFAISVDGQEAFHATEQFGPGTNNVAEFKALHRALLKTLSLMDLIVHDRNQIHVDILTDSTVVRNRINKPWKPFDGTNPGKKRMNDWSHKCHLILSGFGSFKASWIPRESNMEKFGH